MKEETKQKHIKQEMLFYEKSAEIIREGKEKPVGGNLTNNSVYQERKKKLYDKLGWK
jgi:hypothetical protein